MLIKIKSLLLTVSLLFNAVFIILLIVSSMSQVSRFSFPAPDNDRIAAAMIVTFPRHGASSFNSVEIFMIPGETSFLQFSVISNNNQANLLINALYDPDIISVTQTGYGIEIIALSKGTTLMQTVTNDGIKDLALIIVE